MFKYPMTFNTAVDTHQGTQEPWEISASGGKSRCAIPPEFAGPGGAFSPEDLFALALCNCFVATFKAYAQASKLEFADISARGRLIVDLNDERKAVMKHFKLDVSIAGASHPARAKSIAEKAFASGFILNSVKTELQLDLKVEGL